MLGLENGRQACSAHFLVVDNISNDCSLMDKTCIIIRVFVISAKFDKCLYFLFRVENACDKFGIFGGKALDGESPEIFRKVELVLVNTVLEVIVQLLVDVVVDLPFFQCFGHGEKEVDSLAVVV